MNEDDKAPSSASHVRGSLGLLVGKVFSLCLDFVSHVIIVRSLLTNDFAAFGYGLALSTLLATAVLVGLPEALARHVPTYTREGRYGRATGAFVVAIACVTITAFTVVLVVFVTSGYLTQSLHGHHERLVLEILILLVPAEGLNLLFQSLFASLGHIWSIFVRQHVLVPGLRVLVVFLVVRATHDPVTVALAYSGASVAGLLLYAILSVNVFHADLQLGKQRIELPVRELLSFAFPVFLSSLFYLLMTTAGTVLLGAISNGTNVAAFQAVAPPSRLNYLALTMFAILYVPTVSRLREGGNIEAIRQVFTDTTFWLVLLGVPVFAMSTIFAGTFVATLFGARYADSGAVLTVLACGFYVQAAAGMNDMTLRVLGHLRAAIAADLVSLAIGLIVTVVLIISDGALGAAAGLLVAVTVRTLLYEQTLRRVAKISLFERAYFPLHLGVAIVLLVLDGLRLLLHPSVEVDLVLSCTAGIVLLGAFHRRLKLKELMLERGAMVRPTAA